MIFAFDLIAQRLQELAGVNQIVTVNAVTKLLAEEREVVVSRELHSFVAGTEKPANAPSIAWAARIAAARTANGRRRKAVKRSIRQARSVARAAV